MWKIILFVTVVTSYAAYAGVMKCGPGEDLDSCPTNCTDSCPTTDGEFNNCRRPKRKNCPQPKCVCQFNYRRAVNGTCIPTRQCHKLSKKASKASRTAEAAFECSGPNEEYNPCPVYCPTDDCSQATPNGVCPLPGQFLIVVECAPTCRCKPTYWRKDGVCVPYQKCDKSGEKFMTD